MSIDSQREVMSTSRLLELQSEGLQRGDLLWHDNVTRIFYPENPFVENKEGIHLRFESPDVPLHPETPMQWSNWLHHWAIMIGASKVVSEGGVLPDLWQSMIGSSEYTPNDHLVTDVIGRSPFGQSWKPVGLETAPLPEPGYNNRDKRIDKVTIDHFGATLQRYLNAVWVPEIRNVHVFPNGVTVFPPGSEQFQFVYDRNTSLPPLDASEPLFVADVAEVVEILRPHLKGIHLMLGVPDSPKRPWHNIQKALEGFALAEATGQVVMKNAYRGHPVADRFSIRATGSWYSGFKDVYSDTVLNDALMIDKVGPPSPPKWIKRRQKGIATTLGEGHLWTMGMLGFHPHIYFALEQDQKIRLTKRPVREGGADWEGLEPMDVKTRHFVRDILTAGIPDLLTVASRANIA